MISRGLAIAGLFLLSGCGGTGTSPSVTPISGPNWRAEMTAITNGCQVRETWNDDLWFMGLVNEAPVAERGERIQIRYAGITGTCLLEGSEVLCPELANPTNPYDDDPNQPVILYTRFEGHFAEEDLLLGELDVLGACRDDVVSCHDLWPMVPPEVEFPCVSSFDVRVVPAVPE